jgi:hypothetical protein
MGDEVLLMASTTSNNKNKRKILDCESDKEIFENQASESEVQSDLETESIDEPDFLSKSDNSNSYRTSEAELTQSPNNNLINKTNAMQRIEPCIYTENKQKLKVCRHFSYSLITSAAQSNWEDQEVGQLIILVCQQLDLLSTEKITRLLISTQCATPGYILMLM